MSIINKFAIKGLFGYRDVEIEFAYPTMVLIGENGYGKTTILKALYCVLASRYTELAEIPFTDIAIGLNGEEFAFSKKLLTEYIRKQEENDDDSERLLNFILADMERADDIDLKAIVLGEDVTTLKKIFVDRPIGNLLPFHIVYDLLHRHFVLDKQFVIFDSLRKSVAELGLTLLYLPTYRRIEADPEMIGIDLSSARGDGVSKGNDTEAPSLLRFGMDDIEQKINAMTERISRSFVTAYGNAAVRMIKYMVSPVPPSSKEERGVSINFGNGFKKSQDESKAEDSDASNDTPIRIALKSGGDKMKLECTKHELEVVLSRIGNELTNEEKGMILGEFEIRNNPYRGNSLLLYFLSQLIIVYQKQAKYDNAIKKFCSTCNKYLQGKQFVYDEMSVSLTLYRCVGENQTPIKDEVLRLNQLSYGEKQIVSLFAQIYLEVETNFILLIDEPELSLSIYWQETLLPDIMASHKCRFLMAVTHSPFIIGEEMKDYAAGLGEFSTDHNEHVDRSVPVK